MQNTTKKRLLLSWPYFALFTVAGVALRLFFVLRFPFLTPDTYIYGDIAKNWVLHHVYGLTSLAGPEPTYIRLPAYPAILGVLFRIFGVDRYAPVLLLQVAADLGTCFVTADLARRVMVRHESSTGEPGSQIRATQIAFALAALCPFLANYAAVALTETFAILFAALALDLAVAAFDRSPITAGCTPASIEECTPAALGRALSLWTCCGLAIAASILLRPDGGFLLIIIGGVLLVRIALTCRQAPSPVARLIPLLVLALASLVPLAPWAARNWRTFHVFEPLVPFAANSPGEFVPTGFDRWVKTWLVDYASVEDIAWRPDGDPMDISLVPGRAFDDDAQRQRVTALFAAYNQAVTLTPELDRQFAGIAAERIRQHPLRFYVLLPLARSIDMWLRPRTEMLPISPHWWWFDDPAESAWALIFGAIGAFYVGLGVLGVVGRPRPRYLFLLLAFIIFRTLFIAYTESPEPRYTLECYPVIIAFAAVALVRLSSRRLLSREG